MSIADYYRPTRMQELPWSLIVSMPGGAVLEDLRGTCDLRWQGRQSHCRQQG
jgi:hypothetical protein